MFSIISDLPISFTFFFWLNLGSLLFRICFFSLESFIQFVELPPSPFRSPTFFLSSRFLWSSSKQSYPQVPFLEKSYFSFVPKSLTSPWFTWSSRLPLFPNELFTCILFNVVCFPTTNFFWDQGKVPDPFDRVFIFFFPLAPDMSRNLELMFFPFYWVMGHQIPPAPPFLSCVPLQPSLIDYVFPPLNVKTSSRVYDDWNNKFFSWNFDPSSLLSPLILKQCKT